MVNCSVHKAAAFEPVLPRLCNKQHGWSTSIMPIKCSNENLPQIPGCWDMAHVPSAMLQPRMHRVQTDTLPRLQTTVNMLSQRSNIKNTSLYLQEKMPYSIMHTASICNDITATSSQENDKFCVIFGCYQYCWHTDVARKRSWLLTKLAIMTTWQVR